MVCGRPAGTLAAKVVPCGRFINILKNTPGACGFKQPEGSPPLNKAQIIHRLAVLNIPVYQVDPKVCVSVGCAALPSVVVYVLVLQCGFHCWDSFCRLCTAHPLNKPYPALLGVDCGIFGCACRDVELAIPLHASSPWQVLRGQLRVQRRRGRSKHKQVTPAANAASPSAHKMNQVVPLLNVTSKSGTADFGPSGTCAASPMLAFPTVRCTAVASSTPLA